MSLHGPNSADLPRKARCKRQTALPLLKGVIISVLEVLDLIIDHRPQLEDRYRLFVEVIDLFNLVQYQLVVALPAQFELTELERFEAWLSARSEILNHGLAMLLICRLELIELFAQSKGIL